MMSSTLVETVSINYDDFSENFLTCGTCLCTFDSQERTPKLLQCSHTVCKNCLERIAEAQARDTGILRCPICRENITLPRGGISALPPSFLVNQLLDMMARQRREVIPKCSIHPSQELLFCETCDTVFCTMCTNGTHGNGNCEHMVIPFSIAIKRMSEILLYKAHQCISKLNKSCDNVLEEITRLDVNADRTLETMNRSFQEVMDMLERRHHEMMQALIRTRDEKKRILQEQLGIIQGEKAKVEEECEGLQYQVEVRTLTRKIGDLNEKLDTVSTLSEPRENAFIKYEYRHNSALAEMQQALSHFGSIRISKTFPALSTCSINPGITHLECSAMVTTIDYHGSFRTTGEDPVYAKVNNCNGVALQTKVIDNRDGTYEIFFTPLSSGTYKLQVTIFDRAIKDSPFLLEVSDHNNPVMQFGSRGSGDRNFLQPVGIAIDSDNIIYVTDTGNSRIKVISHNGEFKTHIDAQGLENQSGTGIALTPSSTLVVVNWRSKYVTEMAPDGQFINKFTCSNFVEPITIAVNSKGEILVADNGVSKVFIFSSSGSYLNAIGRKGSGQGHFGLISAVVAGLNNDILVADSRIQVFNEKGEFQREIYSEGKGKGQYGGLAVDADGYILATRTDKGKSYVQIFNYSGHLLFCIDSYDSKLKRPNGIAVTQDFHVIAVDLGNDCIKKFRYK